MKISHCISLLFSMVVLSFGCKDPVPSGGGNSDDLPKISIENVTQFELDSDNEFSFSVRLSDSSSSDVSVDFRTESNTALDGSDFISSQGTLNFPAGETLGSIDVQIVADTLKEQDEQFIVQLSNPQNASLVVSEAIGTIRNDDDFVDIPDDGYITPESYGGWDLVWADEFNGSQIDLNNWTHELGASGWGNNELQNYTSDPANSYISNGKLIIEAREDGNGGYTSARMMTANKQEYMFGRIDIRAKLPKGQGIWPALWMLGSNFWDSGWPSCGEIDIMELVGHEPGKTHGTAHWGPQGTGFSIPSTAHYSLSGGAEFAEEFHVFSIVWEFNSIKWLVDDFVFHQINLNTVGNNEYPFNQDFFFIFNIAVGGNWPGDPDATTQFPQQMIVDYVRLFQKQ